MEFKPRHPQPFTLEVVAQLSVPEITGGIFAKRDFTIQVADAALRQKLPGFRTL